MSFSSLLFSLPSLAPCSINSNSGRCALPRGGPRTPLPPPRPGSNDRHRAGSVRQRGEALLDPLLRDPRQGRQFGAGFGLALQDARDHCRRRAVPGLAGEFEPDAVRIVEIKAEQARQLRDRADIIDTARLEPLRDLAEPFGSDDKGAMLHRPDCVAVAGWFLALRDLEKGEQAVIAHIEEIMADLFVGWIAAVAGADAETGRHLHRMHERHAEHIDIEVDRRLHVVGAQREMVHAARNRRDARMPVTIGHRVALPAPKRAKHSLYGREVEGNAGPAALKADGRRKAGRWGLRCFVDRRASPARAILSSFPVPAVLTAAPLYQFHSETVRSGRKKTMREHYSAPMARNIFFLIFSSHRPCRLIVVLIPGVARGGAPAAIGSGSGARCRRGSCAARSRQAPACAGAAPPRPRDRSHPNAGSPRPSTHNPRR